MEAITLENTDERFLISIDKKQFDENDVARFIAHFRMEYLAKKVDLSADIELLGEEIKKDWWQKNKSRLLGND